jgi:6-phosphogluconolactonase/glucosamine-6-phosphate isomerase/deaminase
LGLQHFKEAKIPIVMASGTAKAPIIRKVLGSTPTPQIPATIIHETPQALVILDKAASDL